MAKGDRKAQLAFRSMLDVLQSAERRLPDLLQAIVDHAARVSDADIVVLYQLSDRAELIPGASHGVDPAFLEDTLPRENGLGRRVLANKEAKIVRDVSSSKSGAHPRLKRYGVETMAILPVAYGGVTRGLLYVDYRDDREVPTELAQLMQLFAGVAAQAMERHEGQRVVHGLHQLVSRLTPTSDLDASLQSIGNAAVSILGVDIFTLYLALPDGSIETPPRVVCLKNGLVLHQPDKMITHSRPGDVSRLLLQEGKSRYWPDARKALESTRRRRRKEGFVEREKIASSCGIVLRLDGETLGLAFYNFRTPVSFSEDVRGAIELLSGQAAFAIANAKLFQLVRDLAPDDPRRSAIHRLESAVLPRLERVLNDLSPQLKTATLPRTIRSLSIAMDEARCLATELRRLFPARDKLVPEIERLVRQVSLLLGRTPPKLDLQLTDEQLSPEEVAETRQVISEEIAVALSGDTVHQMGVTLGARPCVLEVTVQTDAGHDRHVKIQRRVAPSEKAKPAMLTRDILIADDERATCALIGEALLSMPDYSFTLTTVVSAAEALAQAQQRHFDLVILDIDFEEHDLDGLDVAHEILLKRGKQDAPKVLIVSRFPGPTDGRDSKRMVGAEYLIAARRIGVDGYYLKRDGYESLPDAVVVLLNGGTWYHPALPQTAKLIQLTDRQRQVIEGFIDGKTAKQICKELGETRAWMNSTVDTLKNRLDAHTIPQLVAKAIENRIGRPRQGA